jgi:hypothetical protein
VKGQDNMSLIQTLHNEGFNVKPHPNTNRTGVVISVQLGTIEVIQMKNKNWFVLVDVRGECYSLNLKTNDDVIKFLCKEFPKTSSARPVGFTDIFPLKKG